MDTPYSLSDSTLTAVIDAARDLWDTEFTIAVQPLPDKLGYRTWVQIGGEIPLGIAADVDPVASLHRSLHRATEQFTEALAEEGEYEPAEDDE